MNEAVKKGRGALLKWGLGALGGGAGISLGFAGIEALRARPEFLPQLLSSGVLGFAALVVGMVIFRSELKNFNCLQLRNAVAQEQLAAGVSALAAKDDQRAREQELTLNHLARQSDQILSELKSMRTGNQ